jgi:hypothetical protein
MSWYINTLIATGVSPNISNSCYVPPRPPTLKYYCRARSINGALVNWSDANYIVYDSEKNIAYAVKNHARQHDINLRYLESYLEITQEESESLVGVFHGA